MQSVILFDGVCSFCDRSVQFIIRRDPDQTFTFAARQGDAGKRLMASLHIQDDADSLLLIDKGICYTRSSAVLHIAKKLKGVWKVLYLLIVVPRPIRDYIYDQFAKRRYKWFGRKKACKLPAPSERERFL